MPRRVRLNSPGISHYIKWRGSKGKGFQKQGELNRQQVHSESPSRITQESYFHEGLYAYSR